MNNYRIVLASASPRRQELLKQIGLIFEVCPSKKEEQVTSAVPSEVVKELSFQKAEDIFQQKSKEMKSMPLLVIGSDTIVSCDGQILGKPADEADACRMLKLLQGRKHQVYTGVTVFWTKRGEECEHFTFYECTEVEFYPMSDQEIASYVASKEPMDKAGAYGIQGLCAAHIRGISGDYNNVVGLPVGRLYQELHRRNLCTVGI
ncbi:MAG: septum formation protein Maf [Lachnospiraceae bacterium]|nr:septum formation protein Maf [Lachnospiraceae bacterium]